MELEDSEYPCSVMEGSAQYYYLVESGEGTKTLNNASTTNQVFAVYESGLSYVFLGDPESLTTDVDFVASTVAINTQCKPISKQCNVDGWAGSTVTYNCSQYFNGSLADAAVTSSSIVAGTDFKMMLFNDSALEQPLDDSIFANTTNPVFVAMIGIANGVSSIFSANGSLMPLPDPNLVPANLTDSDVVTTRNGGFAFALLCRSTIYDATYTWINGSFNNFTSLTVSNESLAKVINVPEQLNSFFGYPYFVNGAIISVFSSTAQELADKMSIVYGRTVLGLVAGAFMKSSNLVEQTRNSVLVAVVPYGPFYTLIALNLLPVAIGIVIGLLAVR